MNTNTIYDILEIVGVPLAAWYATKHPRVCNE